MVLGMVISGFSTNPQNFAAVLEKLDLEWGLNYTNKFGPANTSCTCSGGSCLWQGITNFGNVGFTCIGGVLGTIVFYNLTGTIPSEIGELNTLRSLDITQGNITGNIPSSLVNITGLNQLHLAYNRLSGIVPDLPISLTDLDLSMNKLSDVLPISISQSTNLTLLTLAYNNFTGNTSWINGLNSLYQLDLTNNSFSGNLSQTYNWTILSYVGLNNNMFTGNVPSTLLSVSVCSLKGNYFTECGFTNLSCTMGCASMPPPPTTPPPITSVVSSTPPITSTFNPWTTVPSSTGPPTTNVQCLTSRPVSTAVCVNHTWVVTGDVVNNDTIIIFDEPLVINGNYGQGSGGTLQITGNGPGIIVNGNANLDGTLILNPTGNKVSVISGNKVSGGFTKINVNGNYCSHKVQNSGNNLSVLLQTSCSNKKILIIVLSCAIPGTLLLIAIGVLLWYKRNSLCFSHEREDILQATNYKLYN